METMKITADFSAFNKKLEWLSGLLKAGDVCKRLDQRLLRRLEDFCFAGGGDEIISLRRMPASTANEITFSIESGGLLVEIEAALGALGFEFHAVDEPVVSVKAP